MRKRLALLWTPLVLAVAMLMPASVAANHTTYVTLKNTCSNAGGAYGYGKSVLKIRQWENGKSGVAQFRVRAWAQRRQGSNWVNEYVWNWVYSNYFGNTNASTYFDRAFAYHWGSNHAFYYTRIRWRGEWLRPNGSIEAYQNLNGRTC